MIRFYENVLQSLIDDPSIFAGDIYCVLVDGYEFDTNHSNISEVNEKVSTLTHIPTTGYEENENFPSSTFFTASSIQIDYVTVNTSYSGIVFVNHDGSLLFYMDNIPGLPGISLGGSISLSFSSNANKLFRLDHSSKQVTSGSHIIWAKEPIIPVDVPTHVTRPGGNISYGDVVISSEGKTGVYRDISISGIAHPLTGDITTVTDTSAINQAIRFLLLTNVGERPFSSLDIAGGVNSLLFELGNNSSAVKTQISLAISNYEPRVTLNRVNVKELPNSNSMDITIEYTIKSTGRTGTFTHVFKRA